MVLEIGATSTECFETLYRDIPIDLAIYAKENDLLEGEGRKKLKRLASRSKLTERLVTLNTQRNWIRRMATRNAGILTN